jgi:hypothetical protein
MDCACVRVHPVSQYSTDSFIQFPNVQEHVLTPSLQHSLSSIGLRAVHSAAGWYLCGAAWSTFSFLFCYAFFYLILEHTSAMVPALNLFLCGLSLGEGWTDALYVICVPLGTCFCHCCCCCCCCCCCHIVLFTLL